MQQNLDELYALGQHRFFIDCNVFQQVFFFFFFHNNSVTATDEVIKGRTTMKMYALFLPLSENSEESQMH